MNSEVLFSSVLLLLITQTYLIAGYRFARALTAVNIILFFAFLALGLDSDGWWVICIVNPFLMANVILLMLMTAREKVWKKK